MKRLFLWIVASIAVLGAAVVAFLLLFDWNWVRQPLANLLSDRAHRELAIGGNFQGQWSMRPRLVAEGIRLANTDWGAEEDMIAADRVEVVVDLWKLLEGRLELPEVTLINPKVALERRKDGSANWTFGVEEAAKVIAPEDRTEMPVIGRLTIKGGQILYKDEPLNLQLDGKIASIEGDGGDGDQPIHLEGNGRLQGRPFTLKLDGGSLLSLRESEAPYPIKGNIAFGATSAQIDGQLGDPIRFEGVDLRLRLKGPDLAQLAPLLRAPLPATPPYELSGRLGREGDIWRIRDTAGRIGKSDIAGTILVDVGRPRLYIEADLTSKKLDYRDVGSLIGIPPEPEPPAKPAPQPRAAVDPNAPPAPPPAPRRILPDAPLQVDLVRATDAKVKFRGEDVVAPNAPLGATELDLDLKDGVLKLAPLKVEVAGGNANANITIDARTRTVKTNYDIRLSKFELKRFLDDAGLKDAGSGRIDGRIQLTGTGDTVRESLGSANGDIRISMGKGHISTLAMELIGLDAMEAVGFLIGGDKKAEIRCFLTDMRVENGIATPRIALLDTSDTNVTIDGPISLKDETLKLRVMGNPKDPSLLSARSPITIGGYLSQPSIGIDAAALAARGAGAVALGVLLTPLASILAFIEPGLEQDSDCNALLKANPKVQTRG
ncbi:AsmA family protein [Lacibacterium aquatile]|uniref:AsmA family protein n=1 Tax=Lacibacterium aquatile TaxID=1168082 RepID=A0ABW5DUS2_9PROT